MSYDLKLTSFYYFFIAHFKKTAEKEGISLAAAASEERLTAVGLEKITKQQHP